MTEKYKKLEFFTTPEQVKKALLYPKAMKIKGSIAQTYVDIGIFFKSNGR